MNLKIYEKTRYEKIYRHRKNRNLVITMSKPVKTSISDINGQKIYDIDEALQIRDNVARKAQKATETLHKEDFDTLWCKYMFWCNNIAKQAYNTLQKKKKIYEPHLKNKIKKPVAKITKEYISEYIDDLETTDKQKNHIIKELNTFFNWCCDDERKYILKNPLAKVSKYRVPKPAMNFWTPEQLKKFLNIVQDDFEVKNLSVRFKARLTYTFTVITFLLGDRVGETRALAFNTVDKEKKMMPILHSISYDPSASDFISSTKTYSSERKIDITDKLIDTIYNYKKFLEVEMNYNVKDTYLFFLNFKNRRPYIDTALRKHFNYYIEKAKVPKIRMYDLRHTYAATMMSEGKEAYLFSQRMGHKNIQTTINVYGHLSNETRKEVAKTTDKYI